jgi:integrase
MRTQSPYLVRPRSDRPGDWQVWIRPATGLPSDLCALWTRRSLKAAPPEFLRRHRWPKSQTAAESMVSALIDYLRSSSPPPPPSTAPSLGDYARLFTAAATSPRARALEAKGRPYSPGSIATYAVLYVGHVEPDAALCGLRMDAAHRRDLEAYFSRLLAKLGGPCRTHQGTWAFLRMVFRQYSRDTGAPDPFLGLDKPSYQETVRGALTEAEAVALFADPGNFALELERVAMALVFWAGLRRQEAFALRPEHLIRETRRIRVSQAIKAFGRKFAEEGGTKGRRTREVPLSSIVEKAIDELEKVNGKHEYILSWKDGSRPSPAWWNDAFWAVMRRAKIDTESRNITPHSARHTFASILESHGVPIGYIQTIMGHRSPRTTGGYLHMALEEIDKMTEAINSNA